MWNLSGGRFRISCSSQFETPRDESFSAETQICEVFAEPKVSWSFILGFGRRSGRFWLNATDGFEKAIAAFWNPVPAPAIRGLNSDPKRLRKHPYLNKRPCQIEKWTAELTGQCLHVPAPINWWKWWIPFFSKKRNKDSWLTLWAIKYAQGTTLASID